MQHIIDYFGGRAGSVMSTELLTHRLAEQLGRNVRVTQIQIPGEYAEYRLEVELHDRRYSYTATEQRTATEMLLPQNMTYEPGEWPYETNNNEGDGESYF
jgi:hypothetical protein